MSANSELADKPVRFKAAFAGAGAEGKRACGWNGKQYSTELAKPKAPEAAKPAPDKRGSATVAEPPTECLMAPKIPTFDDVVNQVLGADAKGPQRSQPSQANQAGQPDNAVTRERNIFDDGAIEYVVSYGDVKSELIEKDRKRPANPTSQERHF